MLSKVSKQPLPSSGDESGPYVGPRPFKREDQDIFFGRHRETLELTSLIKAHPEVLLYAQSGAGKTSLVYAKLIPILENEEEFDVLPPARVHSQQVTTIIDEKIKNIYVFNALRDFSDNNFSPIEPEQMRLVDYLKQRPRQPVKKEENSKPVKEEENSEPALKDANGEHLRELRLPRVIIFDQFEEIFTLYPERYRDRQDFFLQVAEALEADPFLRVVFSMREDYIAELDPYIDVLPQKLRTRFRLERLRKQNALAAVTKPLKAERVRNEREFAEHAAESLVESLMMIKVKTATGDKKEVLGEFVDPVQLQVVCETLWENLPPEVKIITEDHLKKYANVDEALLSYYENSVRKAVDAVNAAIEPETASIPSQGTIPIITEGTVRVWFERFLITREGKRNMLFRGDKKTATLQNEVVDELENQHLIRVEMRGEDKWYELSHDRFILPIKESNQRWIRQQPLAEQKAQELEARAIDWINSEKDERLLLDRAALLDAKNWRHTPEAEAISCSNELDSLIRESEAAIEHEDHKQLRMLANEQRLRAEAEHQRARQFKFGLVIASLLLVGALAATIFAIGAQAKAKENEARANKNYEAAQAALAEATAAKAIATEEAGRASREKENADRERRNAVETAGELKTANQKLQIANKEAKEASIIAKREEAAARKAQGEAEAERQKIKKAKSEVEVRNSELSSSRDEALSLVYASDANAAQSKNPELSLRLAIEGENRSSTRKVRYSLRQAYLKSKEHYILSGHKKLVEKGMFSPDGKFIITISGDSNVGLWDAKQNKKLRFLTGHGGPIHALEVSRDSTRIATEAADGTARIWRVDDGTSIVLEGLTGPDPAIAFSPDGKLLATEATIEKKVGEKVDEKQEGATPKVWNTETGKEMFSLVGHKDAVRGIAFSPKEGIDLLATASRDTTGRVWNAKTGAPVAVLRGHDKQLNSVAFDPSGMWVVTSSDDGTARVWEAATGIEQRVLVGHLGIVRQATFSPNGKLILTISQGRNGIGAPEDNVVRIWDAYTGQLKAMLSGHTERINSAMFSSDSLVVVTASNDGTARVCDAETGEHVAELKHGGIVYSAAFSPDNKSVVTTGADGTAQIWTKNSARRALFLARGSYGDLGPVSVKFDPVSAKSDPHSKKIVTTGTDGRIVFWDKTGAQERIAVKIPKRPNEDSEYRNLYDVTSDPNGRFVVTASWVERRPSGKNDQNAHVWKLEDQKLVSLPDLTGHEGPVTTVAYSPKGHYVLTASDDGTVLVWDTSTWKALPWRLDPHTVEGEEDAGLILDASFDPTEKYIATAQVNGTVHLWDVSTGKSVRVIKAHKGSVLSVAFNTEGDLIVTGSDDNTAQVRTTAGKKIFTLSGHTRPVIYAEFSNDGKFIVTTSLDGTVRVWEREKGALVTVFDEIIDTPRSADFSPDNQSIVIGGSLGAVSVFDCEVCRPLEEIRKLALEQNPRPLTEEEREQYTLEQGMEPKETIQQSK